MIPVQPAPEPAGFHDAVRVPGRRAIHERCGQPVPAAYARTGGRPLQQAKRTVEDSRGRKRTVPVTRPEDLAGGDFPSYWSEALDWMLYAYDRVCAFSCFRIHATASPSVDHMVPKSKAWDQVYEWTNYRLAALRVNAKKSNLTTVIDPFEVKDGWFALELTFGQVVPGPATDADPALRARVEHTIDALDLNREAIMEDRLRDIEDFEHGQIGLQRLEEDSPFVARELQRQGLAS